MRLLAAAFALALVALPAGCSSNPQNSQNSQNGATVTSNSATSTAGSNPRHVSYGSDPSQYGELWLPPSSAAQPSGRFPVVVLIHGGFWRSTYALDLMTPLAADLVGRGDAVWNIEYRRVGQSGGGYPGTLSDVASAIDSLTSMSAPLDLTDVVFIGHSAGGQLALWAAGRATLADGAPGAHPRVVPRLAVGQGPVFDLVAADAAGLGGGAVAAFLGGTASAVPDRYAIATPSTTSGVALVVVRAGNDVNVPGQFAVPTPVGHVRVIDIAGEDHFDLIDPASKSWAAVVQLLQAR